MRILIAVILLMTGVCMAEERLTIDNNGLCVPGTTSPKTKLVLKNSPVYPLEIKNKIGHPLFIICDDGDFILRGKKIANDKEIVDIIKYGYSQGTTK